MDHLRHKTKTAVSFLFPTCKKSRKMRNGRDRNALLTVANNEWDDFILNGTRKNIVYGS